MKAATSSSPRLTGGAKAGLSVVLWSVALIAIALLWKFTPLADAVKPEQLASRLAAVRELPVAPLLFVVLFVLGGLVVAPVLALILVTALLFPPAIATAVSFTGVMLSSALLYGIGHRFGGRLSATAGPVISRVQAALADRGIPAVAAIRMLPVAPFTVVNLAAGSIRVRFRDYLIGTALGMLPGIVALSFFGGQVRKLWEDPSPQRVIFAIGALVAWIALCLGLQRWSTRWSGRAHDHASR